MGARSTLGTVVDAHTDGVSAASPSLATLSAHVNSAVTDAGATNTSFSAIVANWASADSGDVSLVWGWDIDAGGYTPFIHAETNLTFPENWQYTFIASGDGTFSGEYNVVGAGIKIGLQPLFTTNDWTSGPLGGDGIDPTGSGTFSVALMAGHTYTMSIANYGNITNIDVVAGSADSIFQWQIDYSAAPEPAAWAMMMGGFGMVGGALRNRRLPAVSFG